MLKVYEYSKCSTCVKALKFLNSQEVAFNALPIVDEPPTMAELKEMLAALEERGGSIKNMFNTSGLIYKEMKLSEKLPDLSQAEALKLLAQNGKLIKRPFAIGKLKNKSIALVGFKEDEWKKALK